MTEPSARSLSSSKCQPMLSLPSRYKLSKTALKFTEDISSTFAFIASRFNVQGCDCMEIPE